MSLFSIKWNKYLQELYPRKRKKTITKMYRNFYSRIARWKKEYKVPQEWLDIELANKINKPCKFCDEILQPHNVSCDHRIPIAAGGSITDLSNLQLICMKCNVRKGRLSDESYMKLILFMQLHFTPMEIKYVLKKLSSKDYGF